MRVVVDRVALDDRLELGRRLGELAVAEVGAAERLADRGLLRRAARRPRASGTVASPKLAVLEQLDALAIELVGVVGAWSDASSVGTASASRSPARDARAPRPGRGSPRRPRPWTPAARGARRRARRSSPRCRPSRSRSRRRETSLTTIASTPLRSSFSRARSTHSPPCSAAKPTRVWSGRRVRGDAGEDVLGRLEAQLEPAAALARDLRPPGARGAEVGDARRPSAGRGRRRTRSRTAPPSSAVVSTSIVATPAGAGSATLAATRVTSAPRRAAARGERDAHAAARAVADEAHRVDRLAGAAGGDQDPQPVPGPGGRRQQRLDLGEQPLGVGQPPGPVLAARGERARRRARSRATPRSRSVARFACVAASAYMRSFIAGATSRGAVQARKEVVSIESQIPAASLAIVFAEAGATRKASAFATTSRWPIGSCAGRLVAGEGAAHRIALELVDRAPARRRSPRTRRRRRSARRSASSARGRRGPALVARRASSSAL